MQTTLPQLPEIGKIYAPKDFPDAHMLVKEVEAYVHLSESKTKVEFVATCGDPYGSGEVIEILREEWIAQGLALVS